MNAQPSKADPNQGDVLSYPKREAKKSDCLSYRLCSSCRRSFPRPPFPCPCLGVLWRVATACLGELGPRTASVAGRHALRRAAVVTAYRLQTVSQASARVSAHWSGAQSCSIGEPRFETGRSASSVLASARSQCAVLPAADYSTRPALASSRYEKHFLDR
jgi:hypothetical protein